MYRSQLLLKQLGIQHWIPQQHPTTLYQADELWRDKNPEPFVVAVTQSVSSQSVVAKSDGSTRAIQALSEQPIGNINTQNQSLESVSSEYIDEVVIERPATISFQCHVMVHEQFILLAQIENEQQQRLFNNIQQACHASTFFMQWPLAIEAWEMNDYVLQGYLQGVFAVHQDKSIFSLGEQVFDLPHPFNSSIKKFASLQQLLESAEQKKALWQALYPYIYDAETNNA